MDNSAGWFELYVQNPERAKAFYEELFCVKLEKLPYPWVDLWAFPEKPDSSNCSGALVYTPGLTRSSNSVLVYFVCRDCAVESDRAVQLGGRLYQAKTPIGDEGHVALVIDPEGNMIGLHSLA